MTRKRIVDRPGWVLASQIDLSVHDGQRTHFLELVAALSTHVRLRVVNPSPCVTALSGSSVGIQLPRHRPRIPIVSNCVEWVRCLGSLHARQGIDLLYIRAAGTAADVAALVWAKRHGVKTILEINGAFREQSREYGHYDPGLRGIRQRLTLQITLRSLPLSFRLASRILVVTPELREYLMSSYGVPSNKINVVSNGVNIKLFRPKERRRCKEELELSADLHYIGFVGSLVQWQGVDDLIVSFSQLWANFPGWRLLLVGTGPEMQELQRLANEKAAADRVRFIGHVPYERIPVYVGAFDVVTVPKKPLVSGYSPLKVYEYLACARPILASELPGLEFVAREGVGRVFQPEDRESLRSELEKLLALPEADRDRMGVRGRQLAEERFSWDEIAGKVLRIATNSVV